MQLPDFVDFIIETTPGLALSSPSGVLAATTLRAEITRENPVESIIIRVSGTVGANCSAGNMAANRLWHMVKRVQLTVNDGGTPRTLVDASGAALIEQALNETSGIDSNTAYSWNVGRTSTTAFQFDIPINLSHPQLPDPLKSFTLLPVHLHRQNPVLTIDIANRAEIDTGGTPTLTINSPTVEIIIKRRIVPGNWDASVNANGGYWNYDLLQSELSVPTTGELNFEVNGPGLFTGILLQTFNSTVARTSSANLYDQPATTQGRTIVQLKQGIQFFGRFRLNSIAAENEKSYPCVVQADVSTPAWGFRPFGSYYFDRLTSDVGIDGTRTQNFGSCLYVNPASSGQRTYLNFPNYTGGTNVLLRTLGRRFSLDVLGQLQTIKAG